MNGPSDPVSVSKTENIDGDLIEPENLTIMDVESQSGEPIGLLIKWGRACWIWGDDDSRVSLLEQL